MGDVLDFEDHLGLDRRIDFMLRRCTNEDGSVNEAACAAEAARLKRRWARVGHTVAVSGSAGRDGD